MKLLPAHELAALLATLITQPEALGCVMGDDEYENLLTEAGQVLARHWGATVEDVVAPDANGSAFSVRITTARPTDDSEPLPIPDFEHLRGSAAAILRSLAERIR